MRKECVVQEWVAAHCTWKQQTVLLSALRGCDGIPKEHPSKDVSRLLRFTILRNADTSSGYMTVGEVKAKVDWDAFFINLDALPVHYVFHLMHAIEIIGYMHPRVEGTINVMEWDPKGYWMSTYFKMCQTLHINLETKEQMEKRLEDKI